MKICMSRRQYEDKLSVAFRAGVTCDTDTQDYRLRGFLDSELKLPIFGRDILNTDIGLIHVLPDEEENTKWRLANKNIRGKRVEIKEL